MACLSSAAWIFATTCLICASDRLKVAPAPALMLMWTFVEENDPDFRFGARTPPYWAMAA